MYRAVERGLRFRRRIHSQQRSDIGACPAHLVSGESQRKIQAIEQRAGIHPRFGFVGIAGRRLALIKRLADAADPLHQRERRVRVGAQRARGRSDQLERRLDFCAIGFARPKFRRPDHGLQHRADVAVARLERLRHAVHQHGRRIVGNEPACQLRGNELSRARMMHEQIDDLLAVLHSARVNLFAEHNFRIGVVQTIVKFEIGVLPRFLDGPTGEAARHFRDVFLRVAAVDTERMEFHQLASVIFV